LFKNTIVLKRIVDRKPKKFNSKMALNIAILFTTLLIIGEYKGKYLNRKDDIYSIFVYYVEIQ